MLSKKKIKALIQQMTLNEKISMVHGDDLFQTRGIKRLNIPPLVMSDGPMGVRQEFEQKTWVLKNISNDLITYFPSNMALAATWDLEHAYRFGEQLGAEFRSRGKDVALAPGINVIRSPLCGRNFEYMSEDPHLISELVVPLIKGIQKNDVAACVKHFALNNQETNRLTVNVEVDERGLEEIYLPGFKAAITEGKSLTIMAAYNQFRGNYCCANKYLLRDILRDRWHFDGIIISDWGAVHSTVNTAMAGLDIEMGVDTNFDSYYFADALYQAVVDGRIDEQLIDEKVENILNVMNKLNMLDGARKSGQRNTPAHRLTTLEIARDSIVLLENRDSFLPIDSNKIKSIAVIGENAIKTHAQSGGSPEIKALYEITPLLGIEALLGGNHKITYVPGYSSDPESGSKTVYNLREKAVRVASSHDMIIYIGGLNHDIDMESKDKENFALPYDQDTLIKALYKVNPNMVVVNISGSPVDLSIARDNCKALIQTWYNGMEGGNALAEVLFGKVSPSGKLPFTIGKKLEDYPSHSIGEFPGSETVHYKESIYVGYRHFNTKHIIPLYPFGYGLSYTTFDFSNLEVHQTNNQINVMVEIENTGNLFGKEIVQLYIRDPISSEPRPYKELKAFKKIGLQPKEKAIITFSLREKDFSYYSEEKAQWFMESGEFNILIGSSSENILLWHSIVL